MLLVYIIRTEKNYYGGLLIFVRGSNSPPADFYQPNKRNNTGAAELKPAWRLIKGQVYSDLAKTGSWNYRKNLNSTGLMILYLKEGRQDNKCYYVTVPPGDPFCENNNADRRRMKNVWSSDVAGGHPLGLNGGRFRT